MDQNELIAKMRAFFYAFRHGQTERVLATLALGLFAAAAYFREEWKEFPHVAHLAYALCAVSVLWLTYRVWKVAAPPPEPSAGPISSAIKGLLPFTVADGKLFAQLGRHIELQLLLGLAQNDRIAISAVRGDSGAGKTSLLQAGLAYSLGEGQCIYWEAVPDKSADALLYAIHSRIPGIGSLDSLPEACPKRFVLLLDQFEQLRTGEPEHAPVFALLDRIAKAPAPYKVSAIVGFRREYAADWLDLEQTGGFRAEQLPINLLAPRTAGDALVILAKEAGFTLDEALVENFTSSVTSTQGVSPVDVAIGLLSLANFVQQGGTTHVGMKQYGLAGGAEGLLLSFVQQKMEEIPEAMRAPLLKGIVLTLVNLSNNQRIAAGETSAVIAFKAEVSENTLAPWLGRLAHPRVRLLEKVGADRYRLPHERLAPVFRRLAGGTLASLDQMRLLLEGEYLRWRETHSRRNLLGGRELRNILRQRAIFVQGETAAGKTEYLAACLRRRAIVRWAFSLALIAAAATGYGVYRAWDASVQEQKLANWGLPPELFKLQDSVDGIDLYGSINDLTWLRSAHLKELGVGFDGSRPVGLRNLKGLTKLSLRLFHCPITGLAELEHPEGITSLNLVLPPSITNLAGLEQFKGLNSLSLDVAGSHLTSLAKLGQLKGLTSLSLKLEAPNITSLEGLEKLQGLTSLSLDLSESRVTSIKELGQLEELTSLSLDWSNSRGTSLAGLEQLKGLNSLSLKLRDSDVTSIAELAELIQLNSLSLELNGSSAVTSIAEVEQLKGLNSLSLDLIGYEGAGLDLEKLKGVTSLSLAAGTDDLATLPAVLKPVEGLTSLSLELFAGGPRLAGLEELKELKELTSLSLDLSGSEVTSLAGLEQLRGLTSLSLRLKGLDIASLAGLEQLKGLTSLSLDLTNSSVRSIAELEQLKGLNSLSLVLSGSDVTSLTDLEKLTGLKSLTLDLDDSKITSLTGLEQLKALNSLEITLPGSLTSNFFGSKVRRDITQLRIVIDESTPHGVPSGYKFTMLTNLK